MAVVWKKIAYEGDAPTAHDLAGAEHNADILSDLNSKISDATLVDTGSIVLKAIFGANTILKANTTGAPLTVTMAASTILGRKSTGFIDALIADDIRVIIDFVNQARSAAVSNTAYAASWNGVTTIAPSKNAVYDKIETLGAGGIWTLYETLSPTNVSTITSGALTARDMWMVIFDVIGFTGLDDFGMRFNGDAGSNYHTRYFDSLALVQAAGSSYYILGSKSATRTTAGIVTIAGKERGGISNLTIYGGGGFGRANKMGIDGYYNASADITSFTFRGSAYNFTGKILIYGMDY